MSFSQSLYFVEEGEGVVTICLVMSGLQFPSSDEIQVHIFTENEAAIGKLDLML